MRDNLQLIEMYGKQGEAMWEIAGDFLIIIRSSKAHENGIFLNVYISRKTLNSPHFEKQHNFTNDRWNSLPQHKRELPKA